MFRTKQLSVYLPNTRGQVARLSGALAEAKVNIHGISVVECTEAGTVRLVVDKPDDAARVFRQHGLHFTQKQVIVAEVPNQVGVLAEVTEKLAAEGVNINFIYGSTGKGRGATKLVIGCTKMPTAEKLLADY